MPVSPRTVQRILNMAFSAANNALVINSSSATGDGLLADRSVQTIFNAIFNSSTNRLTLR